MNTSSTVRKEARRGGRTASVTVAVLLAVGPVALAQVPIDPAELARLKAAYLASRQPIGEPQASRQWTAQELTGVLGDGVAAADTRQAVDLYRGLRPSPPGNGFWFWTIGGSEAVYWALDDGKMGPGAQLAGGGRVTQYEFSFGLHADYAGIRRRPFVIVSFYNAPFDPVAEATDPVVRPPTPVSSVGWLFDWITLPAAGFWTVRTGLIDLAARGLDFDLDETFYVEILPMEWSSHPAGGPVFDPDVFAIFTGPDTVTYGVNQDHMWSDLWFLKGGCDPGLFPLGNRRLGDGDGFYDHPAEMYDGGCSPYLNRSGIILRGLECVGANRLALRISDPAGICVQPGRTVTVKLSQSCLPGLVRGYQAFLGFNPAVLTFGSGAYHLPHPYGLPIITPIVANGGNIDLAAGIALGQLPTSATADLVTLTFTTGPGEGLTNVVFRSHEPPTRFTDPFGQPVVPQTVDTPNICVDGTPPVITCPPDLDLQCVVQVPAPATNYAAFVAQGGTAVDYGCWGPVNPVVTHRGDVIISGLGCQGNPYVVSRTYRATDCAENYSECVQTITVQDTTPPVVTGCPTGQTVTPAAGVCEAPVTWSAPTVTDNCDPNPTVAYLIDLGNDGSVEHVITVTTFTFPVGTHRVTVRARDFCGNENTECFFLVTVNAFNELCATVALEWSFTGTRCVRFELWKCPSTGPVIVDWNMSFTGGVAGPVTVLVPCGDYDCITARDRLHTLRRTAGITINGTRYVAAFTGADQLVGGNLNDDRWIDILDFGVFSSQWGTPLNPNTPCTTPPPHADINGDGTVGSGDFTFIQINFLRSHEANCCGQSGLLLEEDGAGPITSISVAELIELGLGELAAGDLNGDGWLDTQDIVAFMQGVRPKPAVPQTKEGQAAPVSPLKDR